MSILEYISINTYLKLFDRIYCKMTKVKREKSFVGFVDYQRNVKVFPMNLFKAMACFSTFNTDEARPAKVFPTFE